MSRIKLIAIYLPQFHPIPENDNWWGKGFTEWTNVTKAKPRFKGHYQPHLPADLGFYDLRVHSIMEQQASMASEAGIYGFCFYHYWFNGKRLLQAPLDTMIIKKTPNFPFMLCWASENWTRRWDGMEHEILVKQEYSPEDDLMHINFLIDNYFSDSRYIKIKGKPVFVIYRPTLFPNIKKTLKLWNFQLKRRGYPGLYAIYMQAFNNKIDPCEIGFDAAMEFQPDFFEAPRSVNIKGSILTRLLNKFRIKKSIYTQNRVLDYRLFINHMIYKPSPEYKYYPCVSPSWDNSARKVNATVIHGHTPELFGKWLDATIEKYEPYSEEENFIFINAWNEWAEGNHLEPDQKWGSAFLDKTKAVVNKWNKKFQ